MLVHQRVQVFFHMKIGTGSQAQPSQASMKHVDGTFIQDLLEFFHRLGARQEAADAGLVQRDALLVVGLLCDLKSRLSQGVVTMQETSTPPGDLWWFIVDVPTQRWWFSIVVLVGGFVFTILKNDGVRQIGFRITSHIWIMENKIHLWNHQPVYDLVWLQTWLKT